MYYFMIQHLIQVGLILTNVILTFIPVVFPTGINANGDKPRQAWFFKGNQKLSEIPVWETNTVIKIVKDPDKISVAKMSSF